jgi:hypothetical protein
LLKVRVSKDMPLGDYVIQGKLDHVDHMGQSLEVSIPISVVEHDADVQKNEWNFRSSGPNKAGRYLLAIVAFPVILVWATALLLALYVCGDSRC